MTQKASSCVVTGETGLSNVLLFVFTCRHSWDECDGFREQHSVQLVSNAVRVSVSASANEAMSLTCGLILGKGCDFRDILLAWPRVLLGRSSGRANITGHLDSLTPQVTIGTAGDNLAMAHAVHNYFQQTPPVDRYRAIWSLSDPAVRRLDPSSATAE